MKQEYDKRYCPECGSTLAVVKERIMLWMAQKGKAGRKTTGREARKMLVTSYTGRNKEFRAWLQARTANVVDLADYREKRKAALKKAALRKLSNPIIA